MDRPTLSLTSTANAACATGGTGKTTGISEYNQRATNLEPAAARGAEILARHAEKAKST
jgi:hypothetical protein